MSEITSYRDLIVWRQAVDLAVDVYGVTRPWPAEERYGLTAQVRRAATSVPANIAEGYGRENAGSYAQFLRIAQGSLKEPETHLVIAERIGVVTSTDAARLLAQSESVGKLLRALIRKVQP